MRPRFHPRLVNDPFGDPGLFIPLAFEKRALLFDIGRLANLAARDILRISHVFVTHTHMDHFCGLDHLLRLCLGRRKTLYIYGPQGFLANIEGKLAAYNWNLAPSYREAFILVATEVRSDGLLRQTYDCRNGFQPRAAPQRRASRRDLLAEPSLRVQTAILDHGIPCLGFNLVERFHINIIKQALQAAGLATGPWIQQFKQALYDGAAPDQVIQAPLSGRPGETVACRLGDLSDRIARITPGQKIAYITDAAYHEDNARRIVALAREADHLYIESAFLDEDKDRARDRKHLTAGQAGALAGRAGVRRFTVFHFSPRYEGQTGRFAAQARRACRTARAAAVFADRPPGAGPTSP
jgi:ribonuclease Z